MGVMMQGFYWDCHRNEGLVGQWWLHVQEKVSELSRAGFSALWLPPASKGDVGTGMGYDPFDYFDFGDFNQKGSTKTGFGSRSELVNLVQACHGNGMQVYADVVYNHCSGGDEELNQDNGTTYYTRFNPASNQFPRNYRSFNPSIYESYDGHERFGAGPECKNKPTGTCGFPDLCHRNPEVYRWILEHARFLIEEIGFDGFRFDLVKGYGSWMITSILEYRYHPTDGRRNAELEGWKYWRPFGVGESWSGDREILEWMDSSNSWSDNPVSAFDFPLRYRLKDLCDSYGFSLKRLSEPGTLFQKRPFQAVTFVDNHDFREGQQPPIYNDKMLGYAFILTHPGYPCVFWQDYFNHGLALPGQPSGIDALVRVNGTNANGNMIVHELKPELADDLYIMQRTGLGDKPGLIFVLNNRGDKWLGDRISTGLKSTRFVPVAWRGKESLDPPRETHSDNEGNAEFWAPPRGYSVFIPQ